MADTLLLDRSTWDLVLDANGNIARATEPYSLAQDAASAIRTYAGECYWDTTIGIPYMTRIWGKRPSVSTLKQIFQNQVIATVPDVASCTVFIVEATDRRIGGQVQVTSASTGQTSVATFSVLPQQ